MLAAVYGYHCALAGRGARNRAQGTACRRGRHDVGPPRVCSFHSRERAKIFLGGGRRSAADLAGIWHPPAWFWRHWTIRTPHARGGRSPCPPRARTAFPPAEALHVGSARAPKRAPRSPARNLPRPPSPSPRAVRNHMSHGRGGCGERAQSRALVPAPRARRAGARQNSARQNATHREGRELRAGLGGGAAARAPRAVGRAVHRAARGCVRAQGARGGGRRRRGGGAQLRSAKTRRAAKRLAPATRRPPFVRAPADAAAR